MAKTSSPQIGKNYQAEDDARTLIRSQEVRMDNKRHSMALGHLKKQHEAAMSAVEMEAKAKKGLKAAFPCKCGKKSCKECSNAGH
jgi:hypothetical protein